MRYVGFIVTVFMGVALFSIANACGDKFLVNSRGMKQENLLVASNAGRILLYRNDNSSIATQSLTDDLKRALIRSGHTVVIVETFDQVEDALGSSTYDVVMADIADAEAIKGIETFGPSPIVLPLIDKKNSSRDEKKAASKMYGAVLKAPGRTSYVLLLVDESVGKSQKSKMVAASK